MLCGGMSYCLFLLSVLVLQPDLDRATPEKIRRNLDRIVDSRYQTEFPDTYAGTKAGDRDKSRKGGRRREAPSRRDFSPVARIVLIILTIFGAVALTSYMIRTLVYRRRPVTLPLDVESESVTTTLVPVGQQLDEARRLAGRAQFAAATHRLLLLAVQVVEQQRGQFRRSRTIREIVVDSRLAAAVRDPLARMATVVEPLIFGERPANASDFEVCSALFVEIERSVAGKERE